MSDVIGGGFNNTTMPGGGFIQRLQDRLRGTSDENVAHAQRTELAALSQQHWMERINQVHQNNLEILSLGPKSRLSSVTMGEHGPAATWRDPSPRAAPPAAAPKPRASRKKPPQSQPPGEPVQGALF